MQIRDARAVNASIRSQYDEVQNEGQLTKMTRKQKSAWEAKHQQLFAQYANLQEEALNDEDKEREAIINAMEEAKKRGEEASEDRKKAREKEKEDRKQRRAERKHRKEEEKEAEKKRKEEEKEKREEEKKSREKRRREEEAEEHVRMKEDKQQKSAEHEEDKKTEREVKRKTLSVLNMMETMLARRISKRDREDGEENADAAVDD